MRLLSTLFSLAMCACAQECDVALLGGRVMDPESGLDAIRNVRVAHGKIVAITEQNLTCKESIDVKGLVVSPGFIDLHSHGQTDENYRLKARDGVTTALEMEVGVYPVDAWYRARTGKALINFGASAGHIPARMKVLHDGGNFLPRDRAVTAHATAAQERECYEDVERGLNEGALGIGLGIAYTPPVTREEIFRLFQLAARHHAACYVHMRHAGPIEPGVIDGLEEVIADAAETGASLHVVHLPSMALKQAGLAMEMIRGARARGLDVTVEAYPYTAGMTKLDTAIFDPGWEERLGVHYEDLQWTATGERLTAESFARYRHQGGLVIIHNIPEDVVRAIVADPIVIIASDGLITDGKGHPRGAGSYARVLGHYVREEKALPLMDALRKMTLLPAKRLEARDPAMRAKGRLRVGADADITVLDAATITDRATY